MLTPLGNYLIPRPAPRAKAHQVTEETDLPLDAAMVLGVTANKLHIWSADVMLDQVDEHWAPFLAAPSPASRSASHNPGNRSL